jgi:D-alanine--poly(phosphoribitol) ligase subunit 2
MRRASVTEEVLSALTACARTDEVWRDLDLELFELHLLDSLAVVELLVELSDRLDLELSPSEFDRTAWGTPRKIIAYLEARLGVTTPR